MRMLTLALAMPWISAVELEVAGQPFVLAVDAVGVVQGLGGAEDGPEMPGDGVDGTLLVDVGIEKAFEQGLAFVAFETGYGDGVDARAETFHGFNDNATGDAPFEILELWYEHHWQDLQWRVGHIDITYAIDQNEVANDGFAQFMSSALVNYAPVAGRYDNGPGTAMTYQATSEIVLSAGIVDPGTDGETYSDLFRDYFAFAQLAYEGPSGTYRGYVYATDHGQDTEATSGVGLSLINHLPRSSALLLAPA